LYNIQLCKLPVYIIFKSRAKQALGYFNKALTTNTSQLPNQLLDDN